MQSFCRGLRRVLLSNRTSTAYTWKILLRRCCAATPWEACFHGTPLRNQADKAAFWGLERCYSRICRSELDCESGGVSASWSHSRLAGKPPVRPHFCASNYGLLMQTSAAESAHPPDSHAQGPFLRGFYLTSNVTRVIVDFGRLVMCRRRVKRRE